jgi:drug/metabolite transporter (DMT)-like permease
MPGHQRSRLPGAADYALLIALGIIWGVSFTFIKIAVSTVPAVPMTITRLAMTLILMLGLLVYLGERMPPWGRVWIFIALSALIGNALPFLLVAWGEEKIDGALAAILMSPSPLAAAVLAHIFTRDDKLNRSKLAGIGLGIVGIVVLVGIENLTRLGTDLRYELMILLAGVCYGANVVANRWLVGGSAVGNVTAVILLSVVMLVPLALVPGTWSFTPSVASIAAMVVLAVVSTCIGTLMMLALVKRQGPAFTAQVNFLVPVSGVISGALILAERPQPRAIVGLALILAGVAVARRGAGLRHPVPASAAAPALDKS